jgi:hypothetical protein
LVKDFRTGYLGNGIEIKINKTDAIEEENKSDTSKSKVNLSFGETPEKTEKSEHEDLREINGHFNIFKEPCFCPDYQCTTDSSLPFPGNRQGESPLRVAAEVLSASF